MSAALWNSNELGHLRLILRQTTPSICVSCGLPDRPKTQTDWSRWLGPAVGSTSRYGDWERGYDLRISEEQFGVICTAYRMTAKQFLRLADEVIERHRDGDQYPEREVVERFRRRQEAARKRRPRLPQWGCDPSLNGEMGRA